MRNAELLVKILMVLGITSIDKKVRDKLLALIARHNRAERKFDRQNAEMNQAQIDHAAGRRGNW